jgi:sugar/nucleoside kinase (ribokinase family)
MGARVPDVPEVDAEALGERGQTLLLADYPDAGGWRGEAAASLLRRARERGVRTVVSLAPVVLGASGAPLTPADLEPLLPHVDLVCGGQPELRRATRRTDPQEAARALIGGGARAVLAKRGPDGAAVFRPGPAALEREDAATPATASRLLGGQALDPLRRAAAFGAVFDAAYLLGLALNDSSPIRFAAAAAARAALSPHGVLGM